MSATMALGAGIAQADFGMASVGVSATNTDGTFARQAGAHADLRTRIAFNGHLDNFGFGSPDGNVKDITVDLPPGVTGDPTAAPTCTLRDLIVDGGSNACPVGSQVGTAVIDDTTAWSARTGVYNMEHDPDSPGLFALNVLGAPVFIAPRVRPTDYGISALSVRTQQGRPLNSIDLTLWGVPADPVHDQYRFDPRAQVSGIPSPESRRPFMTNSTSCPSEPVATTISVDSWQNPGTFLSKTLTEDIDGTPFIAEGCDRLSFDPSINVQPLSHVADAPTGLVVDLRVPQNQSPDGLATAHVKTVSVTLPNGMSVSPSSAAGLGACAPEQVKLGTDADPTCPASSRIGSVEIDTPLLEEPLKGDVILAKQDDNPFRSLLALYVVAKGPGFVLKLPGKVDADPVTGQLKAMFDNNPQLPFERLRLEFRGGSQAPLATPPACGTYTTRAELTSWASNVPAVRDSRMVIDQGCEERQFAPSFSAGTANPAGGAESPFTFTVTRADRTQYLSKIAATLPAGLLAKIASAQQCPDADAAGGSCPAGSQIGTVSVLSGPGAAPLPLTGRAFLTGPYHGAPFGLAFVVPTAGQAGPFDLGNVVVRSAISVDRTDAHVTVDSDPLPTIIRGFPLRLRQVRVSIDRSGFMFNPTSCQPSSITGSFGSLEGTSLAQAVRFQPLGCGDLPVLQKLAMRFTGNATTDNTHPGIAAKLTAAPGGANVRKVVVKLPLSVALDPENAEKLCTPEQRQALDCPKASIVGTAKAMSILPHPLTGPVYFVQGLRKSATGRTITTLPNLWIPLSADGVTIDVNASSDVDKLSRLVTTFDALPDAPFSEFDLTINGGKHGIIVVSGKPGTCDRDKTIDSQFTGQNGKVVETAPRAVVEGCKMKVTKSSTSARGLTLRLSGLSAGKLTLTGKGIKRSTRGIKQATEASISGHLTASARKTLARRGRLRVTVTVRLAPKSGKATTVKKTLMLKRATGRAARTIPR
jgi:hypothetical protein